MPFRKEIFIKSIKIILPLVVTMLLAAGACFVVAPRQTAHKTLFLVAGFACLAAGLLGALFFCLLRERRQRKSLQLQYKKDELEKIYKMYKQNFRFYHYEIAGHWFFALPQILDIRQMQIVHFQENVEMSGGELPVEVKKYALAVQMQDGAQHHFAYHAHRGNAQKVQQAMQLFRAANAGLKMRWDNEKTGAVEKEKTEQL